MNFFNSPKQSSGDQNEPPISNNEKISKDSADSSSSSSSSIQKSEQQLIGPPMAEQRHLNTGGVRTSERAKSDEKGAKRSVANSRTYLDRVKRLAMTTPPIIKPNSNGANNKSKGIGASSSSDSYSGNTSDDLVEINNLKIDDDDRLTALDMIACVDEFQWIASKKLSPTTYDYFVGGADEETTLKWNRSMIAERFCLRPRVMCDVSRVDLTKYIYGDKLNMPIGLSPTSLHKMAHPEGEKATVRACLRANALMCLSLFSTTSLEEVAKEAPTCVKWQNLYILKDRKITQSVINRAIAFGYRAIVVTCDAPVLGHRRHNTKNNFTLGQYKLENIEDSRVQSMNEHSSEIFDPSVTWEHLADLKKSVGDTIRVIAKGIMTPEDAEQALQAGVDGIFVSNHGGRQLDGAQSTIEALPAIIRAVNRRCPVFVDSGFRTGADVLKALALGADMVFVGRTALWALASYGEDGVHRALEILRDELRRAMMLCGCNKLSDINRNLVLERS